MIPALKAGENAARFRQKGVSFLLPIGLLEFLVSTRRKCCPFFSKDFLAHWTLAYLGRQQEKYCPCLWKELLADSTLGKFVVIWRNRSPIFWLEFEADLSNWHLLFGLQEEMLSILWEES